MDIDANDFFKSVSIQLMSSMNADIAWKNTLNEINRFFPVKSISLVRFDNETNIHKCLIDVRPPDWKPFPRLFSFDPQFMKWSKDNSDSHKDTLLFNSAEAWTEKKDDRDSDLNAFGGYKALVQAKKEVVKQLCWPSGGSLIALKLESQGQIWLLVYYPEDGIYTEEHVSLLQSVLKPLSLSTEHILKHQEIQRLNALLEDNNAFLSKTIQKSTVNSIVGADFGLRNVMQDVANVAHVASSVMLTGETGVGKEVIANAIHNASRRSRGPFIKVNCGAIPDNLVDSELFGHEKGAFTGAHLKRKGYFERAHNGTIFLDEIAELPLSVQVRLLRIVQYKELERVGGEECVQVNVRIISATHRDIEGMVRNGEFRQDLWYRLNGYCIHVPPLRERSMDIPALTQYFLEKKALAMKIQANYKIRPADIERLQKAPWPGNVRELENVVERAIICTHASGEQDFLSFEDVHLKNVPGNENDGILPLDQVITRHITKTLNHTNGKVEGSDGAASLLGLNPSTLRGKMRKLGIRRR